MEKLQIKNNEEFKEYINSVHSNDILNELLNNIDLIKTIIDNNLFWKNFLLIINKLKLDHTLQMFKIILLKDVEDKFLNEEMYVLLENSMEFSIESLFFKVVEFINTRKDKERFYIILENIIKTKEFHLNINIIEYLYKSDYKYIIKDNFYNVLNNCYDVFELKKLVKRSNPLTHKLNNYINDNPSKMIYEILIKGFNLDLQKIKGEKIYDTVHRIIYELMINEKIKYSDIEFLGMGSYSYVVGIGTKVLKVGQKRETFRMENNKRFLKPILRTEINKIDTEEVLGCIEITEKVKIGKISKKDIYIIYKELRDKGYFWIDVNPENLGRLLRKNKIYFSDINPTKESVNYTSDIDEELEEWELVFVDNDYIFTEEEFKKQILRLNKFNLNLIEEYEIKYQNDKKQKNRLTK